MSQPHLHLDLSLGARAEMLLGALLALGAPRAAALDALGAVGLSAVGLEEERARRGGLWVTAARLQVPGELASAPLVLRTPPRATRRGRVGHSRRAVARRTSAKPAATEAAAMPVPGALVLPTTPPPPRVERLVDAWRAGAAARATDLPGQLLASELTPVVKALAHKAARRLASGLVQVAGEDARVAGPAAVRLLAEIAASCALVDSLGPAAITASPVAVSMAAGSPEGVLGAVEDGQDWPVPSPWVLEILAGVPLLEHDRPWLTVDPAGAACVWAWVHRFGARGVTGFSRQGLGAATLDAPAGAGLARAMLGPPTPLATRAGEHSRDACVVLTAGVPTDHATPALLEELRAAGAVDLRLAAEVVPLGERPRVTVTAVAPAGSAEPLGERLAAAGASDVVRTWADRWTGGPHR